MSKRAEYPESWVREAMARAIRLPLDREAIGYVRATLARWANDPQSRPLSIPVSPPVPDPLLRVAEREAGKIEDYETFREWRSRFRAILAGRDNRA